jgi:hypothetical protein
VRPPVPVVSAPNRSQRDTAEELSSDESDAGLPALEPVSPCEGGVRVPMNAVRARPNIPDIETELAD